ncbi:arylformamidase [Fredinandcohnia quinoae]|uniref:Kynurenine formamidase n=1 Tax=Fredinandcohnia quinoae TaxID=2918902 RepID=A0AAW5EES4_9BACI|nr:arylformamidase [Fredinandcohnia sp. SECRCQ15]MCH1627279.1 arylformamidase [Fredinandcohnia sp. SECRCQ15]
MKIIDISQPLDTNTPEWPGDTPFEFNINWTMEESLSVNVGKMVTSTHMGTHIDAPFHFDNEGKRVHELDLELYVGKARVIEVSGHERIGIEEIKDYDLAGIERLLIRTKSWTDRRQFPKTITYLQPELAPFLADKGIKLVGVDVHSVDPLDSKELYAHHSLHQHGIHILEGIILDHVAPGDYELIALPLKIVGGDGSPVRAILRT